MHDEDGFHPVREQTRVLVTGAGGFIGHNLVRYLVDRGYYVRGVDLKHPSYESSPAAEFHRVDLRSADDCLASTRGIDQVYHLAANMGGIGFIEQNKAIITHDNTLIDIHMLEASRVNGIRRFLYTSSACVYPRRLQERVDVAPIREEQAYPAEAEDGYGWQKLIIERLCRHYREDYGLRTYVARLHNIFGPSGEWRGGREKSPAAICRRVALASSDEWIEVWGDGMQTRSYCYISDCIRGIYLLMQSEHCDPVNIGQDRLVSINELVDIVATIARKSIGKRHDLGKPQGVRGRNADISVMRTVTGWKPEVSLEEGLERTYSWVIDQVRKSQRERAERAEQAVLGAAVELRKAVSMALGDLADLIDRLCIVNLKIWHLEEAIRDNSKPDEEIGRLTRTLTPLNEQRATLKNRINELTGLGVQDDKIYGGSITSGDHDD